MESNHESASGCGQPSRTGRFFTCLPNWVFGQTSANEKALLLTLQFHAPNIHPSLGTLARESGLSQRTVQRVLADLEAKGWVAKEETTTASGGKGSNRYQLLIWGRPEAMTDASAGDADPWPQSPEAMATVARGVWPQWPGGMATVANKGDQSKEINLLTREEPPLPPSGGNAREGQGELIEFEALPVTTAVPNALEGGKVSEPPPPTKPVKARKPRFQPSHDLIPAELLPVHPEILGFWATKAGARSEQAWNALIGQLLLILQDPMGGTESLRSQLQTGIDRAPIKAWMSVTYANWKQYGPQPGFGGQGSNRRKTPEEHAADSFAFIEARDARRAAAAAASGQTLLCEVLA